ncbi:MAG: hypothetical protein KDC95_01115 [Planctomycetes bacterium]|nr:hypothetical protein [Planctomycetota bacterium]
MLASSRLALAAILIVSASTAQGRDLKVDARGGVGIYTQIQDAIDASVDGDRIEVAQGSYQGFTVTKAISIFGTSGGIAIVGTPRQPAAVIVRDIPASKTCSLRDVVIFGPYATMCSVQDCRGNVLLEGVYGIDRGEVEVRRSSNVTLKRIYLLDSGPLRISDSHVNLSDCLMNGNRSILGAAIEIERSLVDASDIAVLMSTDATAPAIALNKALVWLRSTRPFETNSARRFPIHCAAASRTLAIVGTGSLTVMSPNYYILTPNASGASAIDTRILLTPRDACGVAITKPGGVGQSIEVRIAGSVGTPFALFLGTPRDATWIAPLDGILSIDPQILLVSRILSQSQYQTGYDFVTVPIPNDARLRSLPYGVQALGTDHRGIVLSNADIAIVR